MGRPNDKSDEHAGLVLAQAALDGLEELRRGCVLDESELDNALARGTPHLGAEGAKPANSNVRLSTAEAAARLQVSRTYVSILCDQGKLGEVVVTEGRQRSVLSSAVEAYLTARTQQNQGVPSPREAAVEAGLYDLTEGAFKNTRKSRS